jgi:ribosomal RNA-processing protein 1
MYVVKSTEKGGTDI